MPTLTRGLAVLAVLAAVGGAPAAARATSCPDPSVAQVFRPWLDPAWYMSVPDGGLEHAGQGWTLAAGATVVQGNEPYFVAGAHDHQSLSLPAGSAAITPPVCISVDHPAIRFFARNTGAATSALGVSVIFHSLDGSMTSLSIGQLTGGGGWAPTPVVPVTVNLLSLLGDQWVSFGVAPIDTSGNWQVDDVYVDPYGKR